MKKQCPKCKSTNLSYSIETVSCTSCGYKSKTLSEFWIPKESEEMEKENEIAKQRRIKTLNIMNKGFRLIRSAYSEYLDNRTKKWAQDVAIDIGLLEDTLDQYGHTHYGEPSFEDIIDMFLAEVRKRLESEYKC